MPQFVETTTRLFLRTGLMNDRVGKDDEQKCGSTKYYFYVDFFPHGDEVELAHCIKRRDQILKDEGNLRRINGTAIHEVLEVS
jgi:hypothetical protein